MSWSCLIYILVLPGLVQAKTTLSADLGLSSGFIEPAKSILNPENRIFEIPQWDDLADLRAELKITERYTKYILRPRVTESYQAYELTNPIEKKYRSRGKIDLTDAFVEWTPLAKWQFTTGLWVDGWGPAEFVNPSNPFFHLNFQNKSFFYKEKGHVLIKALWNPTAKTTLALTAEPASNNEPSFRAEEDFKPQAALRVEWQSNDASQLVGILIGKEKYSLSFLAEYFQFRNDMNGTSIYMEARHSLNPERFEIVDQNFYKELILKKQNGIKTYSVAGLRWEGQVDARLEWIFYEQGYSESEWNSLIQSITQLSPVILTNAARFSRSGLEFPSKNWWSLSVRASDLGPWSDWQWTNRALIAVGDKTSGNLRSGVFQSDLEIPAYQAWTFLAEIQNNFGTVDTELLLSSRQAYYLGVKWAW